MAWCLHSSAKTWREKVTHVCKCGLEIIWPRTHRILAAFEETITIQVLLVKKILANSGRWRTTTKRGWRWCWKDIMTENSEKTQRETCFPKTICALVHQVFSYYLVASHQTLHTRLKKKKSDTCDGNLFSRKASFISLSELTS